MGLFDKNKSTPNGYLINNGILLNVPEGQIIYNIPAGIVQISEIAKKQMQNAEQIMCEGKEKLSVFNSTTFPRLRTLSIQGYIIDVKTGTLLQVPAGQKNYSIPFGIVNISENAKSQIQRSAEEITFDGKNLLDINSNAFPRLRTLSIQGYVIDAKTGTLLQVPTGQSIYNIPKEVKQLNPNLNLMANKVLSSMSGASEIIFEDGGINKIPDGYFTFGQSFSNLKKITLPNGIKSLGNNCIDPTRTQFNLPPTIEQLGTGMYPEVQKLVIKRNIKSLGNGYASHDTNLVYVEVEGSIKELPAMFVNQCKNLKTLFLHEGTEKAGNMAFRGLNSLEYVELPESFKQTFQTSMENRAGSNKRGNSKYDGSNGVFEAQLNKILTIKKIHNGIPYTFQVRKGDFTEISFQNTTVTISSPNGKRMSIDLQQLNQNAVCQVNIQESKIQQVVYQPQQQQPNENQKPIQQMPTQKPIQNSTPIQPVNPKPQQTYQQQVPIQPVNVAPKPQMPTNPINTQQPVPKPKPIPSTDSDPLDSGYTDVEISAFIQEIWQEYIYKTNDYRNLDSRDKADIGLLLNKEFRQRLQRMKRGQKLDVSAIDYLFDSQVKKLNESKIKKQLSPNLAEQQRIIAESQVVPIMTNETGQSNEEIERLKNMKQQILNNQAMMDEEVEQDHGMSM